MSKIKTVDYNIFKQNILNLLDCGKELYVYFSGAKGVEKMKNKYTKDTLTTSKIELFEIMEKHEIIVFYTNEAICKKLQYIVITTYNKDGEVNMVDGRKRFIIQEYS